jgi:hypothetical protein
MMKQHKKRRAVMSAVLLVIALTALAAEELQ